MLIMSNILDQKSSHSHPIQVKQVLSVSGDTFILYFLPMNTIMYPSAGADPGGGGPGPPLSEILGIDFYSGFKKKIHA